jgi:hypothetical protein
MILLTPIPATLLWGLGVTEQLIPRYESSKWGVPLFSLLFPFLSFSSSFFSSSSLYFYFFGGDGNTTRILGIFAILYFFYFFFGFKSD